VNADERREALEAISASAEATVGERLRALEMLRELGPVASREPLPDYAEELADDPERLTRLVELADEAGASTSRAELLASLVLAAPETAEELAQETFIKVLNNIDRYQPQFKFSSWLFKIANNIAIDHLRKRQIVTISMDGSPHAATAAEAEATSFDVAIRQESALEEMEAKELGSEIEKAIARLRPEYRSCIMLRHVEGRSYEEIAATLDLPLGTVKTYIHRARIELRDALGHLRQ